MARVRIISLIACCLLVLQCTVRQEGMPQPVEFYLDQDIIQATKSSLVLEPTAILPEGKQVDTLWIAAVARDMKMDYHLTKGLPYSSATGFPTDKNLGVIAYTYDDEGASSSSWRLYTEENNSRTASYISDTGRWIPSPDMYYPLGNGYMRFFAFGPKDASVTRVSAGNGAGPTLSYTVPADITNQHGLLIATPDERSYPPHLEELSIPLNMKHILSGVRFAVSNTQKLVSAEVSGVYDQGEYDVLGGNWSNFSKSGVSPTYTISISDYAEDMVARNPVMDSPAPQYTLMMVPQHLPEDAQITVQLVGEDAPRVFDVAGQLWEKGKEVTYVITGDWVVVQSFLVEATTWD